LALAVLANTGVTISNSLAGEVQAGGILGHRNFSGLIVNLALPLLIAVGFQGRIRPLMLLAIGSAALAAIAGGSRGVIIFYGVTVLLTMVAMAALQPTSRRIMALVACVIGVAASVPSAQHKLMERFQSQRTAFTLQKDGERQQLEKIAKLMVADDFFGVGLNQFVIASNTRGYADRVGLAATSGSRSATVHNSYLLAYAEAGPIGWMGIVFLLWVPQLYAARLLARRRGDFRFVALAGSIAMMVLAVHSLFEWAVPAMATLYLIGLNMALIAAPVELARLRRRTPQPKEAIPTQSSAGNIGGLVPHTR
jgi:O-antigen ligase